MVESRDENIRVGTVKCRTEDGELDIDLSMRMHETLVDAYAHGLTRDGLQKICDEHGVKLISGAVSVILELDDGRILDGRDGPGGKNQWFDRESGARWIFSGHGDEVGHPAEEDE